MNNTSKQRQMLRVTWLNLLVGFVLMIIFIASTLTLSAGLRAERDSQTARTLEHFSESFLNETAHLRDAMALNKSNANLAMLAAGQYGDWQEMSDYAMRTIELLDVTQKSLSNVTRLIFVAPNVGRAFSGGGAILLPLSHNAQWLNELLAPGESMTDLTVLKNGWHSYRNFAFYVQEGYNGSALIAVVKTGQIAELNTFNRMNPDQHIVVLDAEGNYFSSSFNTSLYAVEMGDRYAAMQTGDSYSFRDVDYVVTRLDSGAFSFLLLTDRRTPERSYQSLNTAIAVVVAATFMLLLLTLLNTFYFRRISQIVSPRGNASGDIERLRQIVQERAAYHRAEIERLIAAAATKSATEKDYTAISATMAEEYDRYFVISIGVQNARAPLSADLFAQLYQFLSDHFNCCGAQTGEGRMTFIAERVSGAEQLPGILLEFFESMGGDGRAWVGLSTSYAEPKFLRRAFEQAATRMMALPLLPDRRLICSDAVTAARSDLVVSSDQIDGLIEALWEGGEALATARLNALLYDRQPPCTLMGMQRLGETLIARLSERLPQPMEGAIPAAFAPEEIYHPVRLLDALCDYARAVREACESAPADVPPAAPPNAVVQWIEAHYAEDISLESVADQFHITPVHLSRWFKKENDVNFSTFLAALRIAHARELLDADPSIRNADLAARVGMASVLTFTRQFKSQTGMTPDQYRKASRG